MISLAALYSLLSSIIKEEMYQPLLLMRSEISERMANFEFLNLQFCSGRN